MTRFHIVDGKIQECERLGKCFHGTHYDTKAEAEHAIALLEAYNDRIKKLQASKSVTARSTDEEKEKQAAATKTTAVESLYDRVKSELGVELDRDVKYGKIKGHDVYADLGKGDLLINVNTTSSSSYDLATCSCGDNTPEKNHSACDSLKNKSYFLNRAKLAMKNGRDLVQVYDWMPEDVIVDIVRSKLKMQPRKFYARNVEVKTITQKEANEFLAKYHMQGVAKGQSYCVGLYSKEGELLQVQTFGKARYNKEYQWEAIRLASKFGTVVIGGVSRGFHKFVEDEQPESCLSYVDFDRSNGGTDEATGFDFRGFTGSKCFWVDPDDPSKRYTDTFLHKNGIDKVLRMRYEDFPDYDGTFEHGNTGLMLNEGYVRIYTSGSMKYGWNAGK